MKTVIPMVLAGLLLAAATAPVAGAEALVRKVAAIDHAPINEVSGMLRSARYEGVYWVHNDSGDMPRLFAIDRAGEPILPRFAANHFYRGEPVEGKREWPGLEILLAANLDWEDITRLGEYLVIADAGNNANVRRDLGLYFVAEPNPREIMQARVLKHVPIRYPEQVEFPAQIWHYDNEALFAADGKLYLISKHRRPGKVMEWESGADLYRLDTLHTDRDNVLVRVDANPEIRLATGADLSPDGMRLAVASYLALWVFERPLESDRWLSAPARRIALDFSHTGQVEAVCWDDDETLLISNEAGALFEVKLAHLAPVAAHGSR